MPAITCHLFLNDPLSFKLEPVYACEERWEKNHDCLLLNILCYLGSGLLKYVSLGQNHSKSGDLGHCYPIERFVMMEMFYICAIQYSSH